MTKHNDDRTADPPATLSRRGLLGGAAALALAANRRARGAAGAKAKRYRVGVIGHTGRGNYGHGLDRVWLDIPGCEIVAVADADAKGLAQALKRLKAPKGYRDYRKMLADAKCDLVSVCPRWLDRKRDMVVAAAEAGVRGIYMEKPLCRTLAEADEMVAACEKHHVKAGISHQTRYSPKVPIIADLIRSGRIGKVLEFRARGKEDRRGGGEDLWVLGTHVLNLVHVLGGQPKWCFATVRQGGRPVEAKDVKEGAEGIGPLAGDEVHAVYRLATGPMAYFDSVRNAAGRPSRYCLWIHGSKGVIEMGHGPLPPVYLLADPSWSPGRTARKWVPVSSQGVGKPEPLKQGGLHPGNVLAVKDLLSAIENDRPVRGSIYEGRTAVEMIAAVFESHRLRAPAAIPLKNRMNPLTMLT